MFTQCPECQKSHQLSVVMLRKNRGMIKCSNCSQRFDALELLSELPAENFPKKEANQPLPWDPNRRPSSSLFWGTGLTIAIAVLVIQLYSLTTGSIAQDSSMRPLLSQLCRQLNCQLPAYKNPTEFVVLRGKFTPASNISYQLNTVFTNIAKFAQPYPEIKLTLLNFNGSIFAERIFSPQDYLQNSQAAELMAVNEQVHMQLDIAKPHLPVGGYAIDFI